MQPIEVRLHASRMRVTGARRDSGASQPEVRRGSDVDEVWIAPPELRPVGASARLALHEPDSKLAEG
jgi:hypothetical protein